MLYGKEQEDLVITCKNVCQIFFFFFPTNSSVTLNNRAYEKGQSFPLRIFFCLFVSAEFLSHMNHFIQVVEKIEADNPELPPIALVKELRKSAGLDSLFIRHYLGGLDSSKAILNPSVSEYLSRAIHHKVIESGEERGVVLTSDGTTVALAPLLLGIEAGLQVGTNTS